MSAEDRIADYLLQAGFGGGIGGRFTIGSSLLSGTDILPSAWTEFFNGPDDDLTNDVADGSTIQISRGWDSVLASVESGKCSATVLKPSAIAHYDPNDPASPMYSLTPGFVPMRPFRLIASNDVWATSHGLFYGFIRTADYNPDTGECVIQAEDLMLWLSRIENPVISPVSGISSSQAVGLLLDSFGFTDPGFRSLSATPSVTSMNFSGDGTVTALDLLKGIIDAEQGYAFVDGNGVFHFEDRYARDRRRVASYAFSAELTNINSRASADAIANRVTVTSSVTGHAQIAEDPTSIQNFGVGDATNITSDYLPDDVSAAALAYLIMRRLKDPHPPQTGTIYNETAALLATQLGLELQQRLTIDGVDVFLERLEHVIGAGGVQLATTVLVSQVPATLAFEIGVSTLADPAVIPAVADYLGA